MSKKNASVDNLAVPWFFRQKRQDDNNKNGNTKKDRAKICIDWIRQIDLVTIDDRYIMFQRFQAASHLFLQLLWLKTRALELVPRKTLKNAKNDVFGYFCTQNGAFLTENGCKSTH